MSDKDTHREDQSADDESLVLACRRGDQAAWEALVRRYQRLIYSIPRYAGLSEDSAAEVFQEVFTQLVKQLDRIEQPARVRAWLVTTARRETLRIIQRIGREGATASSARDELEAETTPDDPPDDAPLPDKLLLKMEAQHLVHQAVLSLDERCRQLLTLLFYHAETPPYAEIAAALGMSEGSIGPTRARCLEKLRRLLEQDGL